MLNDPCGNLFTHSCAAANIENLRRSFNVAIKFTWFPVSEMTLHKHLFFRTKHERNRIFEGLKHLLDQTTSASYSSRNAFSLLSPTFSDLFNDVCAVMRPLTAGAQHPWGHSLRGFSARFLLLHVIHLF